MCGGDLWICACVCVCVYMSNTNFEKVQTFFLTLSRERESWWVSLEGFSSPALRVDLIWFLFTILYTVTGGGGRPGRGDNISIVNRTVIFLHFTMITKLSSDFDISNLDNAVSFSNRNSKLYVYNSISCVL